MALPKALLGPWSARRALTRPLRKPKAEGEPVGGWRRSRLPRQKQRELLQAGQRKTLDIRDYDDPREVDFILDNNLWLRPNPAGGYYGAPDWVRDEDQVRELQDRLLRMAEGGVVGADWYPSVQKVIQEIAKGDQKLARQIAYEWALHSPQSTPQTNLQFALRERNAAAMGEDITHVRTPAQTQKYRGVAEYAQAIGDNPTPEQLAHLETMMRSDLGAKTEAYYEHLYEGGATGVNDQWHARTLGFIEGKTDETGEFIPEIDPETGEYKLFTRGLQKAEHAWLNAMTELARRRANALNLAGKNDWDIGNIQASAWVFQRGMKLMDEDLAKDKRDLSFGPQKARRQAAESYQPRPNQIEKRGNQLMRTRPGMTRGQANREAGRQLRNEYISNESARLLRANESKDKRQFTNFNQALEKANLTYPDYLREHTIAGTSEAIPGQALGHLEGLINAPEAAKQAFTDYPGASFSPVGGRNPLLDPFFLQRDVLRGQGYFEPGAGMAPEFNPVNISRPLLAFKQKPGQERVKQARELAEQTTDPADIAEYERLRALQNESKQFHPMELQVAELAGGVADLANVQRGSAGGRGLPVARGAKAGEALAATAPLDRKLTQNELSDVLTVARKHGFVDIIDTGEGVNFLPPEKKPNPKKPEEMVPWTHRDTTNALHDMKEELETVVPTLGETAERARFEGWYNDFSEALEQPGRGLATRMLLDKVEEVQKDLNVSLDEVWSTPEISEILRRMNERDIEFGQQGYGDIRQDVLNLRTALRRGIRQGKPFEMLRRMEERGSIPLPGLLAPVATGAAAAGAGGLLSPQQSYAAEPVDLGAGGIVVPQQSYGLLTPALGEAPGPAPQGPRVIVGDPISDY